MPKWLCSAFVRLGVQWDCVSYGRIATAGLRTVYFLVDSGTLFVWCDVWHVARFSACYQHPSVGVVLTLAQRPRCLRRRFVALRPFCWVPWCFLLRFGRLLHLLWRRQCASLLHVINSFHCRFDALQDSQVEEHTGIFSHIRTRSSLAVLREVTTLLRRQERKITPRCVSAGGSPDQDLYSGKKKITAIAEQTFSGN